MQGISLTSEELRKLLSCGCSDAVPLYLYRKAGAPLETALDALHFTVPQMVHATDSLRQMGMWQEAYHTIMQPERPSYTDADLQGAMRNRDGQFPKLVGEAQRRLGRTLSTEELKTLLTITDYLRLPTEVVGLLLHFCIERNRRKGSRAPSMRSIEKEAYRWADEGIDTFETASYYIQTQLQLHSRIQQLRLQLQIDQRKLTSAEEQHLSNWINMGFTDEVIRMAYERTCLNTGGLKWAYMNSILSSWHEKGLMTPQQIAQGDGAPKVMNKRKPPAGKNFIRPGQELSPLEKQAVAMALAGVEEDYNGI